MERLAQNKRTNIYKNKFVSLFFLNAVAVVLKVSSGGALNINDNI